MSGLMTKDEKTMADGWAARKLQIREAIADLKLNLEDETDPADRAYMLKHIEIGEELLAEICEALPD